jgi:hypothetical protein
MAEKRSGTEVLDPREVEPKPPFEEQKPIAPPGKDREMRPRQDYGEKTYTRRRRFCPTR